MAAQDHHPAPPVESNSEPAATTPQKPIHSLCIDAGPLIKNDPPISTLLARAEELYTLPSVLTEIRDQATRQRVQTTLLPFLKLRTPRAESVKFITGFARKTGDLEVLSRPDIHLLALTYELECERLGGDHRLRKEPIASRRETGGSEPRQDTAGSDSIAEPALKDAQDSLSLHEGESAQEQPSEEVSVPVEEASSRPPQTGSSTPASSETEIARVEVPLDNLTLEARGTGGSASPDGGQPHHEGKEAVSEESDDDEEGWVTPSNIKQHKARDALSTQPSEQTPQTVLQAALLTSDFAMQNVALRIGLNLLSPSLARITQVRTWCLRCHGCFRTTRDTSRQFCPSCGQATLTRTSCSTDAEGNFRVHLKRGFQFNKRGNVYSVPKPVHGSASGKVAKVQGGGKGGWGQGLILAEDQKEYARARDGQRREKRRDLMDEDYLPNILSGDRPGSGGKIKVGAGRNVNGRKRF